MNKTDTFARAHRVGMFAMKVKEWRKEDFASGRREKISTTQTGSSQYSQGS